MVPAKQLLFRFLATGSCVLSIGFAGLWLRSYWKGDVLNYVARSKFKTQSNYRRCFVTSSGGGIAAIRETLAVDDTLLGQPWAQSRLGFVRHSENHPRREFAFASHSNTAYPFHTPARKSAATRLGFQFHRSRPSGRADYAYDEWWFVLPHWSLVVAAAVLPGARLWARFRAKKQSHLARSGRCAHCGYDLRASNDKCPECGTEIARSAASVPKKAVTVEAGT